MGVLDTWNLSVRIFSSSLVPGSIRPSKISYAIFRRMTLGRLSPGSTSNSLAMIQHRLIAYIDTVRYTNYNMTNTNEQQKTLTGLTVHPIMKTVNDYGIAYNF